MKTKITNRIASIRRIQPLFFIVTLVFVVLLAACKEGKDDYVDIIPPANFSPEIPVDVDPAIQEALKGEGDIYELNREFNKFSWEAFIAIMWPRDAEGNPMPNFTDEGKATWLGWKEAFQVYRKDGQKPAPWDAPRTESGLGLDEALLNDTHARVVLSSVTPTGSDNVADEVDQAFAGQLFDQNGNVVVYEVLMNKAEFDYIMKHSLYNINGQINFSAKNDTLANFPKGNYETNVVGAVEIKFAWKILEDTDIAERYFVNEGYIINQTTKEPEPATLGMIGFHISQKTPTGKQWVWSTFEHIDNLDENVAIIDGEEVLIHPTLRDPDCELCPANFDATNYQGKTAVYEYHTDPHGNYWTQHQKSDTTVKNPQKYFANEPVMKTQAKRMVDIPVRVRDVNAAMQAYFAQQGSVWQYYQLIDTQYPLDQNVPPAPNGQSDFVVDLSEMNKPGGDPNLGLLTNITMETFFQLGNQDGASLIEAANYQTGYQIFGTESCMGCHSSAGIYKSYSFPKGKLTPATGNQLSGDFSWLLSQKAHWNKDSIPTNTSQ